MIRIWNFEELAKIDGLQVTLGGGWSQVTFTNEIEDWEEFISFSTTQSYELYVEELYKYKKIECFTEIKTLT